MLTAGPIDTYVAALHGALRGPRVAKSDLVTEARDGLIDAAERHEQDGLDRATAERAAVEEFGPVADLAPQYQLELALTQCRRTAVLVAVAVAAQSLYSEITWHNDASGSTWQPDRFYSILASTVDYASYAVVAGALVAALACGIGSRYFEVGRRFARAIGIGAIGVVGFFALGGSVLAALAPAWHSGAHHHAPMPLLEIGWPVVVAVLPAWMTYSGVRCVRSSAAR